MIAASASSSIFVRHRYLLLFLLGFLLYVPFLAERDMWYPDEPDIAEVGKVMYESGDWVSPRRVGVIWVDYPPMIYWTATVSAHVFGGYSEFAFRLPTALAAIALVLMTCGAASRWFGARAGLWAGFMLLTFQHYWYNAINYRPDVQFALPLAAGMFVYAAGVGERPRWLLRVAGFALLGVAMLAKGPLGLLLPGLVFVLWHGSRREWRRIIELAPLSVISFAVYLPWFVACARAMGSDNILYELYAQNFARFLSGSRGHEQPFYFVPVVVRHLHRLSLHRGHEAATLPAAGLPRGRVDPGAVDRQCRPERRSFFRSPPRQTGPRLHRRLCGAVPGARPVAAGRCHFLRSDTGEGRPFRPRARAGTSSSRASRCDRTRLPGFRDLGLPGLATRERAEIAGARRDRQYRGLPRAHGVALSGDEPGPYVPPAG
jgi:hypothetical protein